MTWLIQSIPLIVFLNKYSARDSRFNVLPISVVYYDVLSFPICTGSFAEHMGSCSLCKICLLILVSYGEPENKFDVMWHNPEVVRLVYNHLSNVLPQVFLCRSFRFFQKLLSDSFPWEYSVYDAAISHTAETSTLLFGFCVHCDLFNA